MSVNKMMKLSIMEKRGKGNTDLYIDQVGGNVGIQLGVRHSTVGAVMTPGEARSFAIHLLQVATSAEVEARRKLLSVAPVGSVLKLVAVPWKEGEK